MKFVFVWVILLGMPVACCCSQSPGPVRIEPAMVHLRSAPEREWATFPEQAAATELVHSFDSEANAEAWTLSLRQQDVKQSWQVQINDKSLGRLVQHEEDMIADFEIVAGTLIAGENRITISQTGKQTEDDIRVGEITLAKMSPAALRQQARVFVDVVDPQQQLIPARITLVDQRGVLVPVSIDPADALAARQGVVYTATGKANFGLAAGKYRLLASRGFEFGLDQTNITVEPGQQIKRTLTIRREVDTSGWVACDTHVHTVTHSGHGDATMRERMLTLAGEGVELPIATDHNRHIDYRAISTEMKTDRFFTSVIGNEVTTRQGHFNIFPVRAGAETPDHKAEDWPTLMSDIFATPDVRITILNHARDIHSDFRPFSPRHHIACSGENLDDRKLEFNAMEVINSGAVQTDALELFHDWCGLMNRGLRITPVGSSDSHDVSRYIVGQGRTYIRCDDRDSGAIDVSAACDAFLQGRVVVSYGLMADVTVNEDQRPGDLVTIGGAGADQTIRVGVVVRGPEWANANRVQLFVNGELRREQHMDVDAERTGDGVIRRLKWEIPKSELRHDSWLTVVAMGDGIESPHWRTAKPYQPDSIEFDPYTFSSTGPIWIDVDGDGQFSSAYELAEQIVESAEGDAGQLVDQIAKHDSAVAIQVASILSRDGELSDFDQLAENLPNGLRRAMFDYRTSQRASQNARLESRE